MLSQNIKIFILKLDGENTDFCPVNKQRAVFTSEMQRLLCIGQLIYVIYMIYIIYHMCVNFQIKEDTAQLKKISDVFEKELEKKK